MAYILTQQQKTLTYDGSQTYSGLSIMSGHDIWIKISASPQAQITGSCSGSSTEPIIPLQGYHFPSSNGTHQINHTYTKDCVSITTIISCTVSNGSITFSMSKNENKQDFVDCDVTGNLTIAEIYQDIPPISIDKTNSSLFNFYELLYPAHDSFDCDGGCYCYCLDGSQVADGENCPDIYRTWTQDTISIGESVSIWINVPSGKFIQTVQIGSKTYTSEKITFTVTPEHISSGNVFKVIVTYQPATWRTIDSGSFTMSGGTGAVTKYISGLSSSRQTRITVQSGHYSAYELIESGGSYVEPEWCDGGCYCYCSDGSQVDDGQLCYEGGDSYYTTTYTNITPGTYTSSGTTISLTTAVYNGNITISANQLIFNGYKTSGSSQSKTITITKVEQWY